MTRDYYLAPCGTRSAYNRHLRYKEVPCDACREAQRKYCKELRIRREGRDMRSYNLIALCGTASGYIRHLRRKEVPCNACREANTVHVRKWRRKHD